MRAGGCAERRAGSGCAVPTRGVPRWNHASVPAKWGPTKCALFNVDNYTPQNMKAAIDGQHAGVGKGLSLTDAAGRTMDNPPRRPGDLLIDEMPEIKPPDHQEHVKKVRGTVGSGRRCAAVVVVVVAGGRGVQYRDTEPSSTPPTTPQSFKDYCTTEPYTSWMTSTFNSKRNGREAGVIIEEAKGTKHQQRHSVGGVRAAVIAALHILYYVATDELYRRNSGRMHLMKGRTWPFGAWELTTSSPADMLTCFYICVHFFWLLGPRLRGYMRPFGGPTAPAHLRSCMPLAIPRLRPGALCPCRSLSRRL